MPKTPPSDVRTRLDSDNADRYTKIANELGAPRDWLINHILRSIEGIEVTAAITMKPDAPVQKEGKRVAPKRQSNWKINL